MTRCPLPSGPLRCDRETTRRRIETPHGLRDVEVCATHGEVARHPVRAKPRAPRRNPDVRKPVRIIERSVTPRVAVQAFVEPPDDELPGQPPKRCKCGNVCTRRPGILVGPVPERCLTCDTAARDRRKEYDRRRLQEYEKRRGMA